MARSDRAVAATSEQWDADPWMLNSPRGIIDLRKPWQVPHATTDYATKIVAVDPSPCKCPLFTKFLLEIFKGDLELIGYIQ
jgi:putative DNA primase/helicase